MRVCLGECSLILYKKMPIAHGKHRKRKPKTLIPVEVSGRRGAGRAGLGSPPVVGTGEFITKL